MRFTFFKFLALILVMISMCIAAGDIDAANTVTRTGNVIEISNIDSDWAWSDTFPSYSTIRVMSIQFNGGLTDDQCVIKEASDTGAAMFDVTVQDTYDQRLKPFGVRLRPVLDFSAGQYSSGSSVIIILDF